MVFIVRAALLLIEANIVAAVVALGRNGGVSTSVDHAHSAADDKALRATTRVETSVGGGGDAPGIQQLRGSMKPLSPSVPTQPNERDALRAHARGKDHMLHTSALRTTWVAQRQGEAEASAASLFSSVYGWLRGATLFPAGEFVVESFFLSRLGSTNDMAGKTLSEAGLDAARPQDKSLLVRIAIIWAAVILLIVGVFFLVWISGYVIGKTVETGIETFDRKIIGADVNIDSLELNPFTGVLDVESLVVDNPLNGNYESDHFVKAKRVLLDVDMKTLWTSFGREIHLEKVEFIDIDVIIEKAGKSSNVQDILDFVSHKNKDTTPPGSKNQATNKGEDDKATTPRGSKKQATNKGEDDKATTPRGSKAQKTDKKEDDKAEGGRSFVLHKLVMQGIGVKLTSRSLHGHGMHLAVGDINYEDFSKEVGSTALDDIIIVVLKTLLKTVVANIPGLHHVKEGAGKVAETCCCAPCKPAHASLPKNRTC